MTPTPVEFKILLLKKKKKLFISTSAADAPTYSDSSKKNWTSSSTSSTLQLRYEVGELGQNIYIHITNKSPSHKFSASSIQACRREDESPVTRNDLALELVVAYQLCSEKALVPQGPSSTPSTQKNYYDSQKFLQNVKLELKLKLKL